MAVRIAATGQRYRQFHQDRSAGPREDRVGSGASNRRPVAPRDVRDSDCPHPSRQTVMKWANSDERFAVSAAANTASVPQAPAGGSRLVTNPWLGIVGVFLGAGVATLNGRLLTVGLPDFRGGVGFGFGEGSLPPSALNMARMFTGCFCV